MKEEASAPAGASFVFVRFDGGGDAANRSRC